LVRDENGGEGDDPVVPADDTVDEVEQGFRTAACGEDGAPGDEKPIDTP
jgi:hypothetical protein